MKNQLPTTTQQQKIHFYWLDLFRAFAAFAVVLAHSRDNFFQIFGNLHASSQNLATKCFYALTTISDDGVLLFFVLSGFLVGGRTFEKAIGGVSACRTASLL